MESTWGIWKLEPDGTWDRCRAEAKEVGKLVWWGTCNIKSSLPSALPITSWLVKNCPSVRELWYDVRMDRHLQRLKGQPRYPHLDIHRFSCFTCNRRFNCSHSGSHQWESRRYRQRWQHCTCPVRVESIGECPMKFWLLDKDVRRWCVAAKDPMIGKTFEGYLRLVLVLIYRRATIFVFPSVRGGLELIVGWEWTRCCIRFSIAVFLLVLRDFVDIFAGISLVSSNKWW